MGFVELINWHIEPTVLMLRMYQTVSLRMSRNVIAAAVAAFNQSWKSLQGED
jgi:hypothetical protein